MDPRRQPAGMTEGETGITEKKLLGIPREAREGQIVGYLAF